MTSINNKMIKNYLFKADNIYLLVKLLKRGFRSIQTVTLGRYIFVYTL